MRISRIMGAFLLALSVSAFAGGGNGKETPPKDGKARSEGIGGGVGRQALRAEGGAIGRSSSRGVGKN
jgi:hypothetical protein